MSASNPLPPEHWTPNDVIPPEGFTRAMLDRDIGVLNSYWRGAFGYERSPLGWGSQALYQNGEITIADFGCGTGNTLATLRARLSERTKRALGGISCTGISLHDYSGQSLNPATNEAITNGEITYLVSDATRPGLVPPNSCDITFSANAIDQKKEKLVRPWMQTMFAATKPGGMMFINLKDVHHHIADKLCKEWAEQGHRAGSAIDRPPEARAQLFFWISKSAES